MMTLADFLLARYADDSAVAGDMLHQERMGHPLLQLRGGGAGIRRLVNPARLLADCDAKRRVVELHSGSQYGRNGRHLCEDVMVAPDDCLTLRALASGLAGHSDYRDGWR